jgi:hypothetical protein
MPLIAMAKGAGNTLPCSLDFLSTLLGIVPSVPIVAKLARGY